MATARPPGGGEVPKATIGFDFSSLRNAPNVARQAAQATAREVTNAFRTAQREQATLEKQRMAEMNAALAQRRVAVRAAAREETATQLAAQREQAAAEKQRMAEMKAALRQRVIAVKAAAREETNALRAAQREQAQAQMQANRAAGIGRAGGIGAGALMGGASQLAGAFGIGLGVAGVVQAGRGVVESTQLTTAYGRQRIAALSLAGGQAKLNELTDSYAKATGGAIDKAASLSNITRLQATGFADSAKELDRFVRGVRGSSIAMGKEQDYISQETQLAISNTSFRRLDQIGLGITEVKTRMSELRAANSAMTREMAFGEAVLDLLNQKFGALTTSVEGQATGVEKLAAAWKNLQLEMGKSAKGPVDTIAGRYAATFESTAEVIRIERDKAAKGREAGPRSMLENLKLGRERVLDDIATGARPASQTGPLLIELNERIRLASMEVAKLSAQRLLDSGNYVSQGNPWTVGGAPSGSRFTPEQEEDQLAAKIERNRTLLAIDRSANEQIIQQTTQYNAQRASTIASFEKSIAREAQDFARQRLNAERKLGLSILDVHQDSARQRARAEADLERTINDARADADERIGQARVDSAERAAEIVEKFAKDEEKRRRDHGKRLREAAANLDAVAVREEQLRFRDETKERKDAHQEQLDDEGKSLQKRIDEANKAFAKQEADQRASLQRRFDQQAEDDALRIEQMKQAFADQVVEEDIERGIMVARRLEDHQAQLTELDTQHAARIQQIGVQSLAEREQAEEDFKATMDAAGFRTKAYEEMLQRREDAAIKSFDNFYGHIDKRLGGTGILPPTGFGESDAPPGFGSIPPIPASSSSSGINNSRSVSYGNIYPTIVLGDVGGYSREQIKEIVIEGMGDFFEEGF